MNFNEKSIFILDGIGALVSAFLIGVVLVKFESSFGVPQEVLYPLAMTACVFAGYSFLNYVLRSIHWKSYLKLIAFANLAYCILTFLLVISIGKQITRLAWIYFAVEISLVMVLIFFELRIAFARTEDKAQ